MRLAYFGVGATPVRAKKAEAALAGGDIEAAVAALDLDPPDDVQATGAVKKHLAGVLLRRVAKQLMEARCMSEHTLDISLTVNGERVSERVEARKTLVDFLREDLALTGSHVGCEHGVCGACTVRVNGEIVRGCLMLAVQCDGATVETIEGLSDSRRDRRSAGGVRAAQRAAMRLLHARHDRGGAGSVEARRRAEPRRNPRASLRQLLPLHRLPRHRRRGGIRGASARGSEEMKITDNSPPVLTALDRPNSYIGRSVPRPNLQRLTQGRGQYVSDVTLPRMAHVAFVRSPHAHARIKSINADAAKKAPGVIAVVTGAELAKVMTPWVGVLTHLKGLKSAPQYADRGRARLLAGRSGLRRGRAHARASRGCLRTGRGQLRATARGHRSGNRARCQDAGDPCLRSATISASSASWKSATPDKAFAESDAVVETTFMFGRHTGVTTEPRAVVADWNAGEQRLTVYHGTQAPHMMQNLFAKHLGLAEQQVRVITKDVGGSFGIKVHTYADEMATVALSKLLKRPVKFVADRIESFVTDIHARDHRIKAKIGVKNDGTITAFEIDDLTGIGPYSVYPRTSGHRGQPDRQPDRRPLHLRKLSRAGARGVPE